MEDLYSDNDPHYRETRVPSGIPPPSLRDLKRSEDLSRYNPALLRPINPRDNNNNNSSRYQPYPQEEDIRRNQRQQQQQYQQQQQQQQQYQQQQYQQQQQQQQQQKPTYKPKPLNLQPSTSFLKCQSRLSVNEIIDLIKLKEVEVDYDFVCSKVQVENVIQLKGKSSHVPKEIVSQARSKSNPFERIGHGVFMNRAAMKLAAMDADFGLTATKGSNQFKFLDICGGPGGFSEYILWRIHSWGESCHGYGITLKMSTEKDEMNWHTEKFRVDIPKDSFSIIHGQDGTGDLYKPENIRDVESLISKETQNGVDLAVADGGFDFSGHEAEQEQLAQKLILCEIITMLSTLRQGGTFVCKFFDMFTEFTVDLVWLLYQLFDEICITKPLSSRPANSERYVICRNLLVSHPTDLIEKLLDIAAKIGDKQFQFISRDVLDKDEDFVDYVRMRNIKFIVQQTDSLEQFDMFIQNPQLGPFYDQEQIRRHCLETWRIPA